MQDADNQLRDRCQQLYHTMLVDANDDAPYIEFNSMLRDIISKPQISMNILKAALRTMIKLVDLKLPINPEVLIKLIACKFDCHDRDQEEVILLTIQKLMVKILLAQPNLVDIKMNL